nr:bifunctional adenosylcobinamide kinase/adenosylcobinamide-phosphate guanylyltransferase [uncultured Oscillibacter sp.]
MIFVTGPLMAGKRDYIRAALGLSPEEFARRAVWDVQTLAAEAPDLNALAEALSAREIVIATEVGGGLVPTDPAERAAREAAGRLSCLLAERADTVVRVCCGLPQVLKGQLPC